MEKDITTDMDANGFTELQITPLFSAPALQNNIKLVTKTCTENHGQFLSNILKRVSTLEGHLEKTKKKLKCTGAVVKEKENEIVRLKEQIRIFEEERSSKSNQCQNSCDHDTSELIELIKDLQTRVSIVETFLKTDSNSWWINRSPLSDSDQFCQCSSDTLKPDLDLLILQINELNFEAGEIHVCQKTKQGAYFQNCESLALTFFSNGMLLKGHPFREYSDLITQVFIRDILDGFFPSELQSEYPRGVIFDVHDRRTETYNDGDVCKNSIFRGQGCKMDSRPAEIQRNDFKIKKRKTQSHNEELGSNKEKYISFMPSYLDSLGYAQILELNKDSYRRKFSDFVLKNRNRLLSDGNAGGDCNSMYRQNNDKVVLPNITIKDGQVFTYRKTTEKSRQTSPRSSTKIKHLNPEVKVTKSAIQLKIRSLNDHDLYFITMKISETVGNLRSYLPEEVKDCSIMYYRNGLNRIYLSNNDSTLKEYGVMKNSVLVLGRPKIN